MRQWDTKRLVEAIRHCVEVSEECDDEKCSLQHAELADWLTELRWLRELAPITGPAIMLITHGGCNDLGQLAISSMKSIIDRVQVAREKPLEVDDDIIGRQQVVFDLLKCRLHHEDPDVLIAIAEDIVEKMAAAEAQVGCELPKKRKGQSSCPSEE